MTYHFSALLFVAGAIAAQSPTRIDVRTQVKGLDASAVPAAAKQGSSGKFQMAAEAPLLSEQIAVYDKDGNLLAAQCTIRQGSLTCGDGSKLSTLALGELSANGDYAFVIHGAAEQAADGCIVLSGQPEASQGLRATGETIIDDDGRTCAVMAWANSAGIGNLNQIPVRSYTDLQGIPAAFAPAAHGSSHKNGGSDEIGTAAPGANAIPKAGSDGKLNPGWLPAPGPATPGGVRAKDCASASQFVQSINVDATVTCGSPPAGGTGTGFGSVSLTMPPEFDVSGSPLTVDGTIAVTRVSQPAHKVLAGPDSGAPGAPAFRTLVPADLPAQTFWASRGASDRSGSMLLSAVNQNRATPIYIDYMLSASKLIAYVHTADPSACVAGSNCYSLGIYATSDGRLVAHTDVMSMTSTGIIDAPFVEGTVTLQPGWYLLAFTGTATAAKIAMTSNANFVIPQQWATVLASTSGAALPASVTIPTLTSWTLGYVVYAALH